MPSTPSRVPLPAHLVAAALRLCDKLVSCAAVTRGLSFHAAQRTDELKEYREAFRLRGGVCLPLAYLQRGHVELVRAPDGTLCGGFCVVPWPGLRVIEQLPDSVRQRFEASADTERLVEITGVWLDDRSLLASSAFWIRLLAWCAKRSIQNVVFSCDADKTKLARLYLRARPQVIYAGPVATLEGMAPGVAHEEMVFSATMTGMARAYLAELAKRLGAWR